MTTAAVALRKPANDPKSRPNVNVDDELRRNFDNDKPFEDDKVLIDLIEDF